MFWFLFSTVIFCSLFIINRAIDYENLLLSDLHSVACNGIAIWCARRAVQMGPLLWGSLDEPCVGWNSCTRFRSNLAMPLVAWDVKMGGMFLFGITFVNR